MLAKQIGGLLVLAFIATTSAAVDIDYQLHAAAPSAPASSKSEERSQIEFTDRAWATPGIEEYPAPDFTDRSFRAPHCVEDATEHRFDISLEQQLWPLTQQMFHHESLHQDTYEVELVRLSKPVCRLDGINLAK